MHYNSVNYQLNNLSDTIDERYDAALKTIELSHHASTLYLMGKPEQKRKLLKSLLSNCHLKDGSLYPIYSKSFDIFAEGIASDNKRAVADDIRTYLDPFDENYLIQLNNKITSIAG